MLDMGFEAQMNEIFLNKNMTEKNKRLNLMFSATITKHVSNLSKKYMNNDCYLITTSKSICDKNNIYNTNSNVEQIIYYVEDKDKIGKLHEIFQEIQGNVIIFMETKKSVDNLENFLSKRNYNVLGIHGDKPQNLRKEAITLFSSGDVPILIATDVASRGLDFPNVSYVFNYDLPKNIEDYIHRIGRTGRVGNKGKAISFYNEKNNIIAENLVIELKKSGANVPDFLKIYDYESNYNNNNNNNINYYNTYGEENFYYHKNHNNRKFNLNNKKNFYNYKESEKKYYNYNQRNKRKKYNDGHNYWRRNENY
jgi:superfamily II DNA/RNA helicase